MIARFMSFYKPGVTLRYLLERGSYLPRYKQREADNSGTPPELLLAHSLAYSLQDNSKVDSPLLLLLSKFLPAETILLLYPLNSMPFNRLALISLSEE